MRFPLLLSALIAPALAATGYNCYPTCIPSTLNASQAASLSFGQHYAVLNLDLINVLVGNVAGTPPGDAFINNTARWIDAVHAQKPPPLSIFTRLYFLNARQPELKPGSPFAQVAGGLVSTIDDPRGQIYPRFTVNATAGDTVVQKARYYGGTANGLELILQARGIDTVILSGLRTAGVIQATAYRLYDLDYKVYVIANNTIEPNDVLAINQNVLQGALPKLPVNVISIEQAIAALGRSGPAIY